MSKRRREVEVDEAELMADFESALQQSDSPPVGPGTASDRDRPLVAPKKKEKRKDTTRE